MAEISKTRQGLDLLLAAYPAAVPYKMQNTGPWLCVDFMGGKRFAIWTETGNVYHVRGIFLGGEVEDDPFLVVTPI